MSPSEMELTRPVQKYTKTFKVDREQLFLEQRMDLKNMKFLHQWSPLSCVCNMLVSCMLPLKCSTISQGATLPFTREWPTKSLVLGTENVPA